METVSTCPSCEGTARTQITEQQFSYRTVLYGYDEETNTIPCKNCGGQYQTARPSGKVRLNKGGSPCLHSYTSTVVSNCYRRYVCVHCDDTYYIDSSG
jgi:hypothetical protein